MFFFVFLFPSLGEIKIGLRRRRRLQEPLIKGQVQVLDKQKVEPLSGWNGSVLTRYFSLFLSLCGDSVRTWLSRISARKIGNVGSQQKHKEKCQIHAGTKRTEKENVQKMKASGGNETETMRWLVEWQPTLGLTVTEVLLQVVHDLRGVADDAAVVDEDGHLAGGIEVHEPGLVVFAEGQAHVVLLAQQTFLRDGQTHLSEGQR